MTLSRREVIAAGTAAATARWSRPARADVDLRVALIGCGGRGTGAVGQALAAAPGAKLVALGDAFADRLEQCLTHLKGSDLAARVDVPAERRFVGLDAY